MDCLISIGTSIAGRIAKYTVAHVGRQLGYIFCYKRNVDDLKAEAQEMNFNKKMLEELVGVAKASGDQIHDEIENCLTQLDGVSKAAQEHLEKADIRYSFMGAFCYLATRYRISKKAKQIRESVVKIRGKIRLRNTSFRPHLQINFENKDYMRFDKREKFVDQITDVLEDAKVQKIGLYGMPGVGKTTIVKEIARKALEKDSKLFDDAVIVTVSQNPNLREIQQKIAERLGFKFTKEVLEERALELQNRLKDEKKFLIVLDDVWNELKLEDVGIAFESDKKSECKILITSRFKRVLEVDMGVDKNFEVELLSEDEATNWFNVIVGDAAKTRGFKEVGNKIVKKCGCLPLAISTVAHSLKKRGLPIWKDTLRQLERSKHDGIVHSAIKLCYDKVEIIEAKKLILLCALHEEDENIELEDLMRYGWGQIDMFKDAYTLQEARDRVFRWVDLLKDRCLLLDGDEPGTVKMHDVIRDIAISIAKQSHGMHSFRDGREVEEFLREKKYDDLKAIMLPNGYLDELDFERSEYSQLHLMILRNQRLKLPGDFLKNTKQLKVLDFSEYYFNLEVVLGPHLSRLQNLRTLRLQNLEVVEGIAEIGKLKNLEILDFSGCKNTEFPVEIGQLTCLRMLDLRGSRVEVIKPNVVMHLKRLEELYLPSCMKWHEVDKVENNIEEKRNASLDELKHLDHLTALHLAVNNFKVLPKVLVSQKLENYQILIGWYYDITQISCSRILCIDHDSSSIIRDLGFEMLVKSAEVLRLRGLNGMKSVVSELETEGFPELKSLELKNNSTIEYLVNNSMEQIHPCTVFESLEELTLEKLSLLKQICNGEVSAESFKKLRVVKVGRCNYLKKLPFVCFGKLEKIEIDYCLEVEEIFSDEIQDNGDDDNEKSIVEFPQLRCLELRGVPKLREFMSSKILKKKTCSSQKEKEPFVGDPIAPFFNGKFLCFPKLNNLELGGCDVKKIWDDQLVPSSCNSFNCLTNLEISECKCLKSLVSSSMVATFKQLKSLEVKDCEGMEEIVGRDEMMDKISFPKLVYLGLRYLPRLSKFSSVSFIEFPMLCVLEIDNCPQLKTFVTNSSSEDKSNTTMLSLFNQNVAFPSLRTLEIAKMDELKMIWQDGWCTDNNVNSFCELEEVTVTDCKNLLRIFPYGMHTRLRNLKWLEIKECEMVEEIFEMETSKSNSGIEEIVDKQEEGLDDEFVFPHLCLVKLVSLPNLVSFHAGTHTLRFPLLER